MKLTEAEAWEALADYMEATGELPPLQDGLVPRFWGLCYALRCIEDASLISYEVYESAKTRLKLMYGRGEKEGSYYWPPGQLAPRIKACRHLAKLARSKA